MGCCSRGKFERPPRIAQVLSAPAKAKGENSEEGEYAEVFGWVRSSRAQKSVAFVDVSDGSCSAGLQVVASASNAPDAHALVAGGECTTGCSVRVRGRLVESRAKGQRRELQCEEIEVLGACPADEYPLQKKKHSLEFLRSIAHLRPRTRTIQSASTQYRIHEATRMMCACCICTSHSGSVVSCLVEVPA